MKKGFLSNLFHRGKQPDSARYRALEQENARQRSHIEELEHQNRLLQEQNRLAKEKINSAPYSTAGVRRLDSAGMKYLFGDELIACREEADATILVGAAPYLCADGVPVELAIPADVHFESLSQVVEILRPQIYSELSRLLSTYDDNLATSSILPCIWEDVLNESGEIISRRLTLTTPASGSFACIAGTLISELKLSPEIYLEQVAQHRDKAFSESEQDEARDYCTSVLKCVCGEWHELFPGVIFPKQSEEE